ncbi:dehydrodolichyl diphosphate synthase complex subunit DHDDS [Schistocerca nitens]|uniref:dehydrodolichyl diphosphate synthase complex subunit DHDDS n=1 Tax=Schistocerca nitens TaxID=7011 RepID=UPI0021188CAC|nr:dehydrodolichyl diphosphate synthase complex subunit DHDDS [Schistocerca nitens]XP_049807139.1 dehydrodolichyl diphosphate synthase complex subunit DHDDS [Schistocerca nitens]XP_049807140.1 dehydrodolichyl diphosphate synthase complex subunit DHDDS [Schistocerca nitens]XP_049807141.1 dehydrodolichyl diphosphate synthase complex subunit DHDDS [Schistocerca nitens]XP_049807142.1 dehydrodolichyl diphosphate synthase complex subunit DHDDS [Schistocerca nitens]XP_049807143.1 dehydrodolichyl diph
MSWIREKGLNLLEMLCVDIVKYGGVPKHVAFIMDGNRRFAEKTKVKKIEGHTKGFDKLAETLQWCLELGIPEVTVYAFSIENFKRTAEEVEGLMDLARQKFRRLLDEKGKLMERGVRIRVIGNLTLLPKDLKDLMQEAMLVTKDNSKAFLNVAFAYTARDEMTAAVKHIVSNVEKEMLLPCEVDHKMIGECLYTNGSPDPDLLIRTSGEVRFSDFLLWQISSSSVYFTNVLWPNFSIWNMLAAVLYYQRHSPSLVGVRTAEKKINVGDSKSVEFFGGVFNVQNSSLVAASNI